MLRMQWSLILLCVLLSTVSDAQQPRADKKTDSTLAKDEPVLDMPLIALNENTRSESDALFIPSVLYANRDVFLSAASFHFSVTRFRMRGYNGGMFGAMINGMPMNDPDNGNIQWSAWSGLNDVTRNTQVMVGLRAGEQSFGNIGNTVAIDMRASKLREQTQFSYSFGNRSYTYKWMFTKSVGFNKKGWAFAVSINARVAEEGSAPGTYAKGAGYYFALDKRLNGEHLLSCILFGNISENGKQGPVLRESVTLFGYDYNPYWGIQSGRKRNANTGRTHQPVCMIVDDHRIDNHTTLVTTIGLTAGNKSSTSLDWYKAADPRSDYYRYLPSYQADSVLRGFVRDAMLEDVSRRQINWARMYEVNRNNYEVFRNADAIAGNDIGGLRAHYLLQEAVVGLKRISVNSVYNTRLNEVFSFSGGGSIVLQESHYYKKINDLLGADYAVDWNQFAERDFPNDHEAIQNDLNRPDRILHTGDRYGYDYMIRTQYLSVWAQLAGSRRRTDFFIAAELSYLNYLRDGNMRNGLFAYDSYGRSAVNEFSNYACKLGATYKINGRKYAYVHIAVINKPPLFDDVYISPRTRDTRQENVVCEKIGSAETGYIINAPKTKMRLTFFATRFADGMNVMTFYHDGYGNFVNYALSRINKLHYGTEMGLEQKLNNRFTVNTAVTIGRYLYSNRQPVTVTADNDAYVLEKALIYSKNFRVGGTPQEVYHLGVGYQSQSGLFYWNISGSYFREQWLDINPLRRTYTALDNVTPESEQWHKIIDQEKLPDQFTVDFSAGRSTHIKLFKAKHSQTLVCNLSINNLLDRRNIISGGYEQLRFDTDTKNTEKFPPKYFYAQGLNFSMNCSLRF